MLSVTDEARAMIRSLAKAHKSPAAAGVRITTDDQGRLVVSVAAGPFTGDEVVEDSGARLFLTPEATRTLSGKKLIAAIGPRGGVTFAIQDRGARPPAVHAGQ